MKATMMLNADFLMGIICAGFGMFFFLQINDIPPPTSRIFPRIAIGLFIFLSLLLAYNGLRLGMQGIGGGITRKELVAPMAVSLIVAVFIGIMSITNYFVASLIFIPGIMLYFRVKNIMLIAALTIGMTTTMYVLFVILLRVPM